jgi:hypothetical protein
MSDIIGRLLDEAEKAQRKGHLLLAEVCRDAADQLGLITEERNRLREAVQWFIDNDETNQGDEPMPEFGGQSWNEINAYWIDGLTRARAVLKGTGHD